MSPALLPEEDYPTGFTVELFSLALGWFLAWTALYYFLEYTAPTWMRWFPPSSKEHENTVAWTVSQVSSFIHAIFIASLSLYTLFELTGAPVWAQYPPGEGEQPTCQVPVSLPIHPPYLPWDHTYRNAGTAGIAFTMHIVSDVFVKSLSRATSMEMMAHHCAFITVGAIIRSHCMLPYNSAALMAMEASTPFLNIMNLFRNRGERYSKVVKVSSRIFLVNFVIFRLLVNPYSLYVLWSNHATILPPGTPAWQAYFMLIALTAGGAIQFYFFSAILKAFKRMSSAKIQSEKHVVDAATVDAAPASGVSMEPLSAATPRRRSSLCVSAKA